MLDFEAGENIRLAGAMIGTGACGDGYAVLRQVTLDDLALTRAGDDLLLATTGDVIGGAMALRSVFADGLTSISVDGAEISVTGL